MAEIIWQVSGTPSNFNGFHVLALLLHRCHSTEVKQTLHNVWQSPGLVHHIYIFGGCSPLMEFCQVQNSLCVQVFCSPILAALLLGTWAVGVSQTLWHGTRNGIVELFLLVIFAAGSESALTEFCQLENSLQMEKLKQMRLTMSLSNHNCQASYIRRPCSCWERRAIFSTPIFGSAAVTWYFRATSSTHLLVGYFCQTWL